MKPIESSLASNGGLMQEVIGTMRPRQFDQKLSEEDILALQEMFLSCGLHAIKLPTVTQGRLLMYRFLQSLHYYHTVACLTAVTEPPLKKSIFDLQSALQLIRQDEDAIECFFTERFFADFLWIELTSDLVQLPLFMYALGALDELALDKHIPIVALSFD